MIGQKKSFHDMRKVSIASTAIAGRAAGTTTARKMRNVLAPSTKAASTSSSGTAVAMYWRMKKTPNAVTSVGRITDCRWPTRCHFAINMYSGMMPICIGTIMVPIVKASSAALKRNRSLAKAKPARVQNATVPIVTHVDTITELISPWVIGAVFSASLMLCQTDPVGSNGGVFAFGSALVCDDITIV